MKTPRIHCKFDEILDLDKLKVHPKNRNEHPEEQVQHLSRLYQYYGIRHPIIISNRSGYIVAGHGRLLAALIAEMTSFPVVYQDFDSDELEYGFLQADNGIALQAELNQAKIREDIAIFGEGFKNDWLGIANFEIKIESPEFPELSGKSPDFQQRTFILSNEQNDILNEAMAKAQKDEDCEDELNQNKNGNTLSAILKRYVYG